MPRLLLLLGVLALQDASAATPQEAAESLNAGLAKIRHLSEADLLSDESSPRFAATRQFIRERQCAAGSANPIVFVSLPSKVNLTGSVDSSGGITISGMSSGETGAAVKPTSPGAFAIPLRVSSLTAFPKEYLRDALLDTRGLPDDLAKKLQGDAAATYEKLNARIQALVDGYDPRGCPERGLGEAWFIFIPPTF
ncbi:MAG TPA: hypothetical protein VEU32_06635 [Burkholderiales bacterium]|nr:hypothetical protein [Burkholderiales bacterium]